MTAPPPAGPGGGVRAASGAGTGEDTRAAVDAVLASVQQGLGGAAADLAVLFLGAAHARQAEAVRDRIAEVLAPGVLLGVSAQGVVSDGLELEDARSVAVWAAALPGAALTPLRYAPPQDAGGAAWPEPPADAHALLLLVDPFSLPAQALLGWLGRVRPDLPVAGGLASGARAAGEARLLLDGAVHPDGAVAVALGGRVRVRHLVSQGCRPVGPPFVVTSAERNVVGELAGAPAATRIREVYEAAGDDDRALLRTGLHIGIVIDEYADEHDRGNFLVRGVIGADPTSGAVAIGDRVQVGQTVRFHVRDARSADEDLRGALDRLAPDRPRGALLFTCNGRGRRLFAVDDHDAGLVHAALGEHPVGGFFAAGELGRVGDANHLHGFTVSALVLEEP